MLKKSQLKQLELFKGIAPQTMEKLVQSGKILDVSKGTILMRAKEPVPQVYVQLAGKSIIYNLTQAGKRKILFIFGQGALINEHICNDHTASVYCETMEESKLFSISVQEFMKLMAADFELTKNIFEAQERKIWRLSHQLKNTMSSIYLERKLASKLWKLARDFGVPTEEGIEIDMSLSITFLADMLGVPRETTSRICSDLTELGLMKMNKKRITIVDPAKMSAFYKTGKIE